MLPPNLTDPLAPARGKRSASYPQVRLIRRNTTAHLGLRFVLPSHPVQSDIGKNDVEPGVPEGQPLPLTFHGLHAAPNYHTKKGVLYFNPGSAGPRRFHLPVTVGMLTIGDKGDLKPEIVYLSVG